jgi:hypothetical protein
LIERRNSLAKKKAAAAEIGPDEPDKLDDLMKEVDTELAGRTPKAPAKDK